MGKDQTKTLLVSVGIIDPIMYVFMIKSNLMYLDDYRKIPDSKLTSLILEGCRILDQFGQLMVVERVRGLLHCINK